MRYFVVHLRDVNKQNTCSVTSVSKFNTIRANLGGSDGAQPPKPRSCGIGVIWHAPCIDPVRRSAGRCRRPVTRTKGREAGRFRPSSVTRAWAGVRFDDTVLQDPNTFASTHSTGESRRRACLRSPGRARRTSRRWRGTPSRRRGHRAATEPEWSLCKDVGIDAQQDHLAAGDLRGRGGQEDRGSRLEPHLRPGGDDLPDRLQDREGAARPDEAGPAVLLPDAGREGQPRLRRARRGAARRHVPQRRAALGRVDEAVPGDHPVPGNLGRALDGDGRPGWRRARICAPGSPCRWSTSSATRRSR